MLTFFDSNPVAALPFGSAHQLVVMMHVHQKKTTLHFIEALIVFWNFDRLGILLLYVKTCRIGSRLSAVKLQVRFAPARFLLALNGPFLGLVHARL